MNYRIGFGYDLHRLVKGRKLFLGGIEIAHSQGLLGHSDADVLIHAIADALLGAACLGDIGEHFSDKDARFKDLSGQDLLAKVSNLIKNKKYRVVNIDAVVIAEEPKISPLRKEMQSKISRILKIKPGVVSIKGKTNEGLAETGRKQAIAAYAVALLARGG